MKFRKREEKEMLGIISRLGIKLETNDGYKSEPEDEIRRAVKLEYDIIEDDIVDEDEIILDAVEIKNEYPDEEIIDIAEYSEEEFENYMPPSRKKWKHDYNESYSSTSRTRKGSKLKKFAEELKDEFSTRTRQSVKLKDEYPYDKKHHSKNKILKYLAEEDDDYKDDVIYEESNYLEGSYKLGENGYREAIPYTNGGRRPPDDTWKNYLANNSTEHEVILNCTACEYVTNKQKNVRRHIQRVHLGNKDFERGKKQKDIQNGESDSQDGVKREPRVGNKHYDRDKKRWVNFKDEVGEGEILNCDDCEFSSKWKKNLRRHKERVHMGIKTPEKEVGPKNCSECDFTTERAKNLRKHKRNMHPTEEQQELTCDKCLYTTRKRRYLLRHIRESHTEGGEKRCTYEDCNYVSKRNSRLTRHVKEVHMGDRSDRKKYPLVYKHLCDQCDYKAPWTTTLKEHQKRVHLKIKDQQCTQCDFKTAGKDGLRKHINYFHLKIKEHECPKCSLKMTTALMVRQHIKAVHDRIKDQMCPHCGAGFAARGNLRDHVKRVHPELPELEYRRPMYNTT